MALIITAVAGLVGAILMFCGDMLLYFTTADFKMDGTFAPYIDIMKKLPAWRLKLGGLLGPIAAFFYCVGYIHIALATMEAYRAVALAATLICSLGIIVGGAYHAQFTYFGLLGKVDDGPGLKIVSGNVTLLSRVSLGLIAVGLVILAVLVACGQTFYPQWFVVLTPAVTYFLSLLWGKLPQPFRIVLIGGWYNLIFVLFFGASLLMSL